jgi:hypothetical protein
MKTELVVSKTIRKISKWTVFLLRLEATVVILASIIKSFPTLIKYFKHQDVNDELEMKQGILTSLEVSLVLIILSETIQLSFLGDRDMMGIFWILGILITHFAVNHMAKNGREEIRKEIMKYKKDIKRDVNELRSDYPEVEEH